MPPGTEHVGKGVHPYAFITRRPSFEFNVPSSNARFGEVLCNGLHKVQTVGVLPKSTVDEHDARYSLVLLERRRVVGHGEVGVLPRFCAPLHAVNGHGGFSATWAMMLVISVVGEVLSNREP